MPRDFEISATTSAMATLKKDTIVSHLEKSFIMQKKWKAHNQFCCGTIIFRAFLFFGGGGRYLWTPIFPTGIF